MPKALYDDFLGRHYARFRRPDPRIASALVDALGDAKSVINIGAGTGAYEPTDREVVAVEPSARMIAQRREGAARVVRASAEKLPFEDRSFDAAMAILTIHHWPDLRAGLLEMRRVSRDRVIVLTWDPGHAGYWLTLDYFPDILEIDRRIFPTVAEFEEMLAPDRIESRPVLIPHDCEDGFLGAYWRRPWWYLDADARSAISSFAKIENVELRVEKLRDDLEHGRWQTRNAALSDLDTIDLGYRLVIAACETR